jgi:hypothetical protein
MRRFQSYNAKRAQQKRVAQLVEGTIDELIHNTNGNVQARLGMKDEQEASQFHKAVNGYLGKLGLSRNWRCRHHAHFDNDKFSILLEVAGGHRH